MKKKNIINIANWAVEIKTVQLKLKRSIKMMYFGKIFVLIFAYVAIVVGETIIQVPGNNEIYCNEVKCPANTTKCIASEQTTDDLSEIKYYRECQDAQGNSENIRMILFVLFLKNSIIFDVT